ncbi:MAG: hypothetical protein HQK49_06490 [Oligoflexia bacterium]|nr:hypothetical protein [Oligoflexia bacterium]
MNILNLLFLNILFVIIFLNTQSVFSSTSPSPSTPPPSPSTETQILKNKGILLLTSSLINKRHDELAIGFLTHKSIFEKKYFFNAFATAFISNDRDQDNSALRTGALGFKGGLFLPTNPWFPLMVQLSLGFAKTAYQEDPWFGRKSQTLIQKDMLLAEAGFLYSYHKFFLSCIYQVHNIKTMPKRIMVFVGVNF